MSDLFDRWPVGLACPYGPYRAVVIEVHDGDTVTLMVSLGFDCFSRVRVRLYGINSPELSTTRGIESRDFLRSRLPVGTQVRLTSSVASSGEQTRSFVRYVGSIEYVQEHNRVTLEIEYVMVEADHAIWCDRNLKPLTGPPPALTRWGPGV